MIDLDGHVKLADFGLSKIQLQNRDNTTFCGSIEYMAPEMILRKSYGYQIDFYSLGAVLYEMISGLPPFYTEDEARLQHNVVHCRLDYPSGAFSPEAKDLLRMLLHKDQNRRVQSLDTVKKHPWCAKIDWSKVLAKKVEPPFKPDLYKCNFD